MIKIICIGKIKENYFKEAILEYQKRLSKYTKLEIIELLDVNYKEVDIILEKEKNSILKKIDNKDYVISLAIEGNMLDSIKLSEKIEEIQNKSLNIAFVIGGSYGLHEDVKKRSDYLLSFSKMTFPHQLFRVILLEQIYRCFKIMNNETYHK